MVVINTTYNINSHHKINNFDDTNFFTSFKQHVKYDEKWNFDIILRRNFVTKKFELFAKVNDYEDYHGFNYKIVINDKFIINLKRLTKESPIYQITENDIDLEWNKIKQIKFEAYYGIMKQDFVSAIINFDHKSECDPLRLLPNQEWVRVSIPDEYKFSLNQEMIKKVVKSNIAIKFDLDKNFSNNREEGIITASLEMFQDPEKFHGKKVIRTFPAIENAKLIILDNDSLKKDEIPLKLSSLFPTDQLFYDLSGRKYAPTKHLKSTLAIDLLKGNFVNINNLGIKRTTDKPLDVIFEFKVLETKYKIIFLGNKQDPIDKIKYQLKIQKLDTINWEPSELHIVDKISWIELINTKFKNIDDFILFIKSRKEDEDE